jgi:heme exporter protein B
MTSARSPHFASRWLQLLSTALIHELRQRLRQPSQLLHPIGFAVLVALLFGFAVGPQPEKLTLVAPAALFIALLLATFLSMELLFSSDFEDGTLDALSASGRELVPILYGKALAFWLAQGLSLLLALPLLMVLLNISFSLAPVLIFTFVMVSLGLSFLGLIGSALTVRLRAGAMLLMLLILPQAVPLLIFSLGAINAAQLGDSTAAPLLYLSAVSLALFVLAPLAAKCVLSQAIGD